MYKIYCLALTRLKILYSGEKLIIILLKRNNVLRRSFIIIKNIVPISRQPCATKLSFVYTLSNLHYAKLLFYSICHRMVMSNRNFILHYNYLIPIIIILVPFKVIIIHVMLLILLILMWTKTIVFNNCQIINIILLSVSKDLLKYIIMIT